MCQISELFRIFYLTLTMFIVPMQSQQLTASIPVTMLTVSSLWQPQMDVCQDPVHGGIGFASEGDLHIDSADWVELKTKLMVFHHRLIHSHRLYEGRFRPNTLRVIRNHTVNDFININQTQISNQDQVTPLYVDISRLVYVFSVLDSDGARQCSIDNPSIYLKLRNQVLPEVYSMVSGAILNWPVQSCTMRLTTNLESHVTCEEIRNLVLLVYRYVREETERILQQM